MAGWTAWRHWARITETMGQTGRMAPGRTVEKQAILGEGCIPSDIDFNRAVVPNMAVLIRLIIVREHSQLPPKILKKDGRDSSEAVVARGFCNVLFFGACRFLEPVYSGFDSLESIIDGNPWFTIRARSPHFVGAIFSMRTRFTTPRTCLNFDDLSISFIWQEHK
ncbi:hypothetical protein VTI28DRAFT_6186 [Corynascus sepedonium]